MNDAEHLGRIQRVDLRKAWPHEAADFTPWLAEHLTVLSESVGLDLELQSQEAPVGDFSLDLLARVTGTSETVIIENQLEPTDHDHLGKLLTYAGGCDADVILWLAREFRDEHRQALDWLNQRTVDDTRFFGVVVEVWAIDDSRPAPHFTTVAAPNEWRREAARNVRQGSLSDKNLRYGRFFQGLIDALRDCGFTNARKGQPQNWYYFSAGHAQRIRYEATLGQGNRVRVGVYVDNTDQAWNKTVFDRLKDRKESLEAELGESLKWQRLDHRRASRISIERSGGIDDDDDSLSDLRAWMVDRLLAIQRVFGPVIDELVSESDAA